MAMASRLRIGVSVRGDGVVVENLTVRRYAVAGVAFGPAISGWRGSYLTAYANGRRGVSAVRARQGRFDHVHAAGHPESGIHLGECDDCSARVNESAAASNAVGFENGGANGAVVTRSRLRRNRVGAVLRARTQMRLNEFAHNLRAGIVIVDRRFSDTEFPNNTLTGNGAGIVFATSPFRFPAPPPGVSVLTGPPPGPQPSMPGDPAALPHGDPMHGFGG